MSEQVQEPGEPVEESAQEPDEPVATPGPMTPEEQEQADQDEQAEGSGEPEEPEAHQRTQKEYEKMFEKLDREAKRHRDRVTELLEEDALNLLVCPLCDPDKPGFVMPTPDVPERFPAVREFMGEAPEEPLRDDPRASRCDTCDGFGVVATGSRMEGQVALPCEDCNGKGWKGQRGTVVAPPPVAPPAPGERNGPTPPTVSPEDQAAIDRLRAQGIVVIPPAVPA